VVTGARPTLSKPISSVQCRNVATIERMFRVTVTRAPIGRPRPASCARRAAILGLMEPAPILIITHRHSSLLDFDRILVLEDGRSSPTPCPRSSPRGVTGSGGCSKAIGPRQPSVESG